MGNFNSYEELLFLCRLGYTLSSSSFYFQSFTEIEEDRNGAVVVDINSSNTVVYFEDFQEGRERMHRGATSRATLYPLILTVLHLPMRSVLVLFCMLSLTPSGSFMFSVTGLTGSKSLVRASDSHNVVCK